MANLATVRAEIKAWERSFKDSNGRAPTVDDIKQNPAIADKYKQYKKLSKAAAPVNPPHLVNSAAHPSTPPRTRCPTDPPSLLFSKSRPVQSPAPLASFNPFSPQKKNKGKEKDKSVAHRIDESRSNPFGKPSRNKKQSPSPEPFPVIRQSQISRPESSSKFSLNSLPEPTSAVSRARKRLRGDPVSPSPNKDKRRRVTSQTSLPFPRLNLDAPSSDEGDNDLMDGNSSFVDNSPIKAPTTGKLYPQLFEETLAPMDLFGSKGSLQTLKDIREPRNKTQTIISGIGRTKPPARKASTSKQITSEAKSSSLERSSFRPTSNLSRLGVADAGDSKSDVSSSRSSAKRALSDEEFTEGLDKPLIRTRLPLIPPSPPPSTNNMSSNRPGKGKAKATGLTSRKKAKINNPQGEQDSDEPESQAKLRIVGRNAMRRQHVTAAGPDEDAVTSDSEPILTYARFATPHGNPQNNVQQEEGNVEIDLPDELRRVLALQSADSKLQVSSEDRLVKGLLYGRRMARYDPHKGGEIWDVGEDHHAGEDGERNVHTENEDDWEGEPVPWEVGEL